MIASSSLLTHADFLKLSISTPQVDDKEGAPAPATDETAAQEQRISSVEILSRALQGSGEVRIQALRVLAVAAANNVPFQKTLLKQQGEIVPWLLEVRHLLELVELICNVTTVIVLTTRTACRLPPDADAAIARVQLWQCASRSLLVVSTDHSKIALQLSLDVGLGDEGDANTTAAVVGALASLARNLPASETHFFAPESATDGVPSTQPNAITLLLLLCDRFWPSAEMEAEYGRCRPCRQIVARSLGLLTDLASNDNAARLRMKSSASVATAWGGAPSVTYLIKCSCAFAPQAQVIRKWHTRRGVRAPGAADSSAVSYVTALYHQHTLRRM